jgi:hypothetical protein
MQIKQHKASEIITNNELTIAMTENTRSVPAGMDAKLAMSRAGASMHGRIMLLPRHGFLALASSYSADIELFLLVIE